MPREWAVSTFAKDHRGNGDLDIAGIAALIGDPARAAMLLALGSGQALSASELAESARVRRSTASSHLAKLVDGGLLTVESRGKGRYYRVAGPEVAHAIEALGAVAQPRPVRALSESGLRRSLSA